MSTLLRFAFLKAFVQHKDMPDIEVETYYVETPNCTQSSRLARTYVSRDCMCTCMPRKDSVTNKENWISLPLSDLRKIYTTETQKKFLEEQVVASRGLCICTMMIGVMMPWLASSCDSVRLLRTTWLRSPTGLQFASCHLECRLRAHVCFSRIRRIPR